MRENDFVIRPETPADRERIYHLVQTAFKTAQVSDGDEQDFVNRLREGEGYVSELALVMEERESGRLIGQVMLTEVYITGRGESRHTVLLMAPLAVALEHRSLGLGGELVREALHRAGQLGYGAVFLVGNPDYYSRFGFVQASNYGVTYAGLGEQYARFVQARELLPGALTGKEGLLEAPY